jgi:glutathione synthase/RimK-type ligase-like ATP-grasp enzyme
MSPSTRIWWNSHPIWPKQQNVLGSGRRQVDLARHGYDLGAVHVAIATMEWLPEEFRDDEILIDALRVRGAQASAVPWDDRRADWGAYDAVVIRSTWDYARRRDEFLAWADTVGDRLHNPPALVRWNTDKRYLAELATSGLPVVETTYVDPWEAAPALHGEVVVKPTVSAGGRDTGRFGPGSHHLAVELIGAIGASGRTAMVQPYLESIDDGGETAIVFVDGRPSHGLRKRAVLTSEGVAPTRDDRIGAAEAMYDSELVTDAAPEDDELAVASAVIEALARQFSGSPLYARVDLARDGDGVPVVLEVEAVEPNLYLGLVPGAVERLVDAIVARAAER